MVIFIAKIPSDSLLDKCDACSVLIVWLHLQLKHGPVLDVVNHGLIE